MIIRGIFQFVITHFVLHFRHPASLKLYFRKQIGAAALRKRRPAPQSTWVSGIYSPARPRFAEDKPAQLTGEKDNNQ